MYKKVFNIIRIADHIRIIKLAIEKNIIKILSYYAPQAELDIAVKDTSYDQLQDTVRKVSSYETFIICGDFNDHNGNFSNGYKGVLGCHDYSFKSKEGKSILKLALARNLSVGKLQPSKKTNRLKTYQSNVLAIRLNQEGTYINFTLGEKLVTQYIMFVGDKIKDLIKQPRKVFKPKLRAWKLNDRDVANNFM